MIGTVVILLFLGGIRAWQGDVSEVLSQVSYGGFIWLLSSFPLLVSFTLAIISKHNVTLTVLLISTIAFATWYGFILHFVLFSGSFLAEMALIFIGIWSLPVMIPAWITTLVLNWRYTKNKSRKC